MAIRQCVTVGVRITAASIVLASAGCSSKPTSPPTVSPGKLDSVLLTAQEINQVMGASGMQAPAKDAIDYDPDRLPATLTLSNPDCLGAVFVGEDKVYQGSGYTAISLQSLSEPGDDADHRVTQAAVSFSSADQALALAKSSAVKWKGCAGQTITETDQNDTSRWTFANLVGDAPKISLLRTLEGGDGWACQSALNAVANVVLDVFACGFHISNQASQITDKMAAKVTQNESAQPSPASSKQAVLPFTGLGDPVELRLDSAGNIYVSDRRDKRVVKLSTGSNTQTDVPFTGLAYPNGLAVDTAGAVYVTDSDNHKVLKLPAGSTTQTELPFPGLQFPAGVAVDGSGNVYISDSETNRVQKLTAGATTPADLPFNGLDGPIALAVDSGGAVYVADAHNKRVVKLAAGSTNQTVLPFTGLTDPSDVWVDTAGNVYVSDRHTDRILKLAAGSASQIELPFTGLSAPSGVTVDTAGNVYVSDANNDRVVKLPPQ